MSNTRFELMFRGLVCVATLALYSMPANAADLYDGSLKDTPYVAPFSWTGAYIGVNAGLGAGDAEGRPEAITGGGGEIVIPAPIANFFSSDFDMSGATYGGHLGYNYQSGNVVYGIEGSIAGSSINGDGPAGLGFIVSEREVDWLATVTGRLGYAMGKSLVYAKGGVAFGEVSSSIRLGGISALEGDERHVGWTVGAGFEHAISQNITFRIEYAHVDLGSKTHSMSNTGNLNFAPAGSFALKSDVDMTVDTISVGVSYKF
jgi:outer membrane immunogenic protein